MGTVIFSLIDTCKENIFGENKHGQNHNRLIT